MGVSRFSPQEMCTAYCAQVATAPEVSDPAWLYTQLAPHADELAMVGVAGDYGGAVDSLLPGWPGAGDPGRLREMGQPDQRSNQPDQDRAVRTWSPCR